MNLEKFSSQEFGSVRAFLRNGEPWFVAKDVCEILKLTNATVKVASLDADEVAKFNLGGLSGEVNIINESGLYSLILTSRKPEAKKFKRWVTSEVLPAIRKTGTYSSERTPLSLEEITLQQARILLEHKQRQEQLEQQQRILEARMNNFDQVELENPRQKLRAMINRYAYDTGCGFNKAWSTFTRKYNNAYQTNLKGRITNYENRFGKRPSRPEYLELVDELEDAIRVADKMLQEIKQPVA